VLPPRKWFVQNQAQVLSLGSLRSSCFLKFYFREDFTSKREVAMLRLISVYVPSIRPFAIQVQKVLGDLSSTQERTRFPRVRQVSGKYKTGPKTLPWGTPARMHLIDDHSPLTSTIKFRSKRYDFTRRYCAVGSLVFNLNSKPSCLTRSKASLTSR